MNRAGRTVSWAVLAFGCLAGGRGFPAAADEPPRAPATPEELVRELGSSEFATRERAGRELWRRGRAAIPALETAAGGPNPEVARRAAEVLDAFGWYVFPDTPPAVLERVAAFRTGKAEERNAAFADLLKLGRHGRAAARAILLKDLPPAVRDPLVAHLTTLLRREVPLLLFDGKADEAADLLALHATGTSPEGAADFAAFQVLRGTLPAATAAAEAARATARKPAAADLVLAHLYRANRDWARARKAAADFPRQPNGSSLVEMLLEEEGDWAALLDGPPPAPLNLPDAYRLTFLRLAGRPKAFADEARRVRESAAAFSAREDVRDAAFSLLLNNRAADATGLIRENRQNLGLLAEILIARLEYKGVLDLTAGDRAAGEPAGSQEQIDLALRRARVFQATGRRDDAVQLFTRVADGLRLSGTQPGFDATAARRALVRSELRAGLRDLACDHAARFIGQRGATDAEPADAGETMFELMFGGEADTAETLYRALRKRPGAEPGPTLRLVRDLIAGAAPQAGADEAARLLSEEGPGETAGGRSELNSGALRQKVTRLMALAAVYRGAGRPDEAAATFAAAAGAAADGPDLTFARAWVFGTSDAARPWLEHADFLYDLGRFADAAVRYEAGWRRFPDQPLLLFLSGRAFAKAGNREEGKRRMDLAHWVGLGNERARGKFLEELIRRGEARAAKRETDLLLRACWSRDFYFGNVMNQAARAAALGKDWATAELCVQRSLLVLIKSPGVHYVDTTAYFQVPHEMLVYRARGLLAAGQVAEAMGQARACLDVTPGHVELAVGMVSELDRLGRKSEADELFDRVWGAHRKILTDYPGSPTARHALATLGAGCRRELERSLEYAKEAVVADPKSTSFRETLAEVLFRRGERGPALKVMTELTAEHPRNRLFRRQLVRYRSGDLNSPIPETEDQ